MLDSSNRPQDPYRRFVDHTQSRGVLAAALQSAFDDLYLADQNAHEKSTGELTGWFKTKTGTGDAVAKKIATTFKSLAAYGDFSARKPLEEPKDVPMKAVPRASTDLPSAPVGERKLDVGLVNRFEIHLPDTQNVETFRAIFRALREELLP